jgi:hypothetical protein
MKTKSLITRIRLTVTTALRYGCRHAACRKAMKKVYTKTWEDERTGKHFSAKITITRQGTMYRVVQTFYAGDTCPHENSWVASYGWHSNGHLIAIGSTRYLIFDPLQRLLYLEEWIDDDRTVNI